MDKTPALPERLPGSLLSLPYRKVAGMSVPIWSAALGQALTDDAVPV